MSNGSQRILEEPPGGDALTDYDRAHLSTYLRLLDADQEAADWEEVARIVLGLDVTADRLRAKRVHDAHLARARWLSDTGFKTLLRE